MGNENLIQNTELQNEQLKDETETFDSFINVMVQIVEKYGKTVLQELDCAAQVTQPYISHFPKHAWTNKDGTYKEVYYYICGRNKQERGHHCDYKASLRKTDIEPLVIEAVKELVSDKYFAKEIEKRIGVQTDTTAIDKELANYESKLKEVDLNKARLEREIDNLPIDARFRERKIHDMTLRLDGLYDTIVELEERIEDAKLRKSSIEMETITLDNIYKLMLNFGKLYDIISDEEKKSLITYLIKEIQIYPNGESEQPLKSIEFNFPIYRDGQEVRRLLWEKGNTVESVVLLSRAQRSESRTSFSGYSPLPLSSPFGQCTSNLVFMSPKFPTKLFEKRRLPVLTPITIPSCLIYSIKVILNPVAFTLSSKCDHLTIILHIV